MEDHSGVVVDNFSLRGNSGMILERLDVSRCQALNKIRPYDLIVLQYGLNVVSDSVMNYGWYSSRMVKVINHIQLCFPEADILMLGGVGQKPSRRWRIRDDASRVSLAACAKASC